MIRLGKIPTEPYWLPLAADLRFLVRPPETPLCAAADAAVMRMIGERRKEFDAAKEVGAPYDGPDWNDDDTRTGQVALCRAIVYGQAAIVAWEGVYPAAGDTPSPVSPAAIAELMRINSVRSIFINLYLSSIEALVVEGNGSGPAPNGTSAGAPLIAPGAGTTDAPAPMADAVATESTARI